MNGMRRDECSPNSTMTFLDNTDLLTPVEQEYAKHVYHLYVVRHRLRNELQQYLLNRAFNPNPYPTPVQKVLLEFISKSMPNQHKDGRRALHILVQRALTNPYYPEGHCRVLASIRLFSFHSSR